jgi:hypothetical protein
MDLKRRVQLLRPVKPPRRRSTGRPVNPHVTHSPRPGRWVDDERCVCGAVYKAFRGGMSFVEAAHALRARAKAEKDDGGGYRSRGPVLWMMRANKLTQWYAQHAICGQVEEERTRRREAARCPWCTSLCPGCDPDNVKENVHVEGTEEADGAE